MDLLNLIDNQKGNVQMSLCKSPVYSSFTVRASSKDDAIWEVEKMYNSEYWQNWFTRNWYLSIYITVAYLVLIFWLQAWMKDRTKFDLRKSLFVWNCFVAIFSVLAIIRTSLPLVEFLTRENGDGWSVICKRVGVRHPTELWGLLFTLSKAIQLGDTFFVVLGKKPLTFLHCYHHVVVLLFTWYTFSYYESLSAIFGTMNYIAHGFLYTYLAVKSVYKSIPRAVPALVVLLEIIQMMVGLIVTLYAFYNNERCRVSPDFIYLALGMYSSFFALFSCFLLNFVRKGREAEKRKRE